MWTDISRNYFFNSGSDAATADENFKLRYCSLRLNENMERHQITARNLRNVLSRLSAIVPDLEQTTPGWSRTNAHRLMVLFGRGRLKWNGRKSQFGIEIRQPRFGVYGHEGKVFIWTDRQFLFNIEEVNGVITVEAKFDGYSEEDWIVWPTTDDGKLYYRHPLLDEVGNWNPQASLDEGSMLAFLLYQIQESLPPSHFVLSELFGLTRSVMGLPEEFGVIFPKLIDQLIPSERRDGSGKAGSSQLPAKKEKSVCAERVESPSPAPETPTPCGLDQIAMTRHDALGIGNGQDSDYLIDAPEVKGRFYVYALIDPTDNSKPFYIGKGFHDRATQHFRIVRPNENGGQTHTDDNKVFIQGGETASILEAELERNELTKSARIEDLCAGGYTSSEIIRVIARGLSESAAFAIEALTIRGVFGPDNLTNQVAGHHEERFRARDDWNYLERYDLAVDSHGAFQADSSNDSYVYVLRDPSKTLEDPDHIFYVGKGNGNRLCQHFSDANNGLGLGVARLDRLRQLLDQGHPPRDIGRIVARVNSDALAYVVESFYIKFVVGFRSLTNVQPGHLYGMFRSKGDWERRYGFDLPTEVGGSRRELLDAFLGEGLDTMIYEIINQLEVERWIEPFDSRVEPVRLHGAGELGVLLNMSGVEKPIQLRVQVRFARRIQLFLIPSNAEGRRWMREKFDDLGMTLRRKDAMFGPKCWWGAKNLAMSSQEAFERATQLINFARALQTAKSPDDLNAFQSFWLD